MMLGAGESPTPLVHTIILKDDHPFPPDILGGGPLPHLMAAPVRPPATGAFGRPAERSPMARQTSMAITKAFALGAKRFKTRSTRRPPLAATAAARIARMERPHLAARFRHRRAVR